MDTWRQNVAWLEIVSYAMQSAWILSRLWLSKLHGSALPRIDSSRNEKRLVRVDSVMRGWTEGDKNLSNLSYRLSFFFRQLPGSKKRNQQECKARQSTGIVWTSEQLSSQGFVLWISFKQLHVQMFATLFQRPEDCSWWHLVNLGDSGSLLSSPLEPMRQLKAQHGSATFRACSHFVPLKLPTNVLFVTWFVSAEMPSNF